MRGLAALGRELLEQLSSAVFLVVPESGWNRMPVVVMKFVFQVNVVNTFMQFCICQRSLWEVIWLVSSKTFKQSKVLCWRRYGVCCTYGHRAQEPRHHNCCRLSCLHRHFMNKGVSGDFLEQVFLNWNPALLSDCAHSVNIRVPRDWWPHDKWSCYLPSKRVLTQHFVSFLSKIRKGFGDCYRVNNWKG